MQNFEDQTIILLSTLLEQSCWVIVLIHSDLFVHVLRYVHLKNSVRPHVSYVTRAQGQRLVWIAEVLLLEVNAYPNPQQSLESKSSCEDISLFNKDSILLFSTIHRVKESFYPNLLICSDIVYCFNILAKWLV